MIHWLVGSFQDQPFLEQGLVPADMLAESEYIQLANLRTEKRRREWLLGRWTAKHLLIQALGMPLNLNRVAIDHGPLGAPYALLLPESAEVPYHISISHCGRYAFCALVDKQDGWIGADIERVEQRPPGFEQEYYSPVELRCLEGHDETRSIYTNLIWSAKESTLKAMRLGLRMDTRQVTCLPGPTSPSGEDWMPFNIELVLDEIDTSLPVRPLYPNSLLGWWRMYQDYVITLVVYRPGPSLEKPEVFPIHIDRQGKMYG